MRTYSRRRKKRPKNRSVPNGEYLRESADGMGVNPPSLYFASAALQASFESSSTSLHDRACACQHCSGRAAAPAQRKKNSSAATTTPLSNESGTKTELPVPFQLKMEQAFETNFSNVNVYTNSNKAKHIGAYAYTQGEDIHFAQGQYNPTTSKGQELIGHELTHVVQQRAGRVKPTEEIHGVAVNDSTQLESEAKDVGKAVAQTYRQSDSNEDVSSSKDQKSSNNNQQVIQGGFWSKIKKGFKKVGKGIANAGKKVWGGVKNVGKKAWGGIKKAGNWLGGVGKKVWGGIKKAGNWLGGIGKKIWGGLKKAGKWVWNGVKYVAKQTWYKIKGIFQRAWRWATSLPQRMKRLLSHLWKGLKSMKPWSLAWWKKLGKASTWKSFLGWIGEFALYGAEALGIGEIYETLADIIKFNTRPLTGAEIKIGKEVFGNSINFGLVRVDDKSLLGPSWTGRAYVSFHTINTWGPISPDTLIHELTHVWQYENMGAMYMPRALHGNSDPGFYDFGGIEELKAKKDKGMNAFNVEQQGDILRYYYRIKHGLTNDSYYGSKDAGDLDIYQIYVDEVRSK